MKKDLSLIVFVDAFGWEVVQKYPVLKDIVIQQRVLETVFGYSATCIPSIVTGAKPRDHGHFAFYYYDPENSPFKLLSLLRFLPFKFINRGRVRSYISKFVKKMMKYTGYFQLYAMPFEKIGKFNYSEKKNIYTKTGIINNLDTIFDYLKAKGIRYHLSDWSDSEKNNIEALTELIKKDQIDLAYLYLPALDGVMHAHSVDSVQTKDKISELDSQIRQLVSLVEKMGRNCRLFVFSDHGMTNTTNNIDLQRLLKSCDCEFSKDYTATYDATIGRFWFFNEEAKIKITNFLQTLDCGIVLSNEKLKEWGCDFKGNMYGELFFLLNPGSIIVPSDMGIKSIAAMHGFSPEDKHSKAALLTNVEVGEEIQSIRDMYTLIKKESELYG